MRFVNGFLSCLILALGLVVSQWLYIGEMQGYQIHFHIIGLMICGWILGFTVRVK